MPYKIITSRPGPPGAYAGLSALSALATVAELRRDGWPFLIVGEHDGETLDEARLQRRIDEGALSLAYVQASRITDPSSQDAIRSGAQAAARRSLDLEPHNAFAEAATAEMIPMLGNWLTRERALRNVLKRHPDTGPVLADLSFLLLSTGRAREGAKVSDQLVTTAAPTPSTLYFRIVLLWCANRLEEAARVAAQALDTFPRNRDIWFTVFFLRLYAGRPEQAIAMAQESATRPMGIPDPDFESIVAVARAVQSRASADIDAAVATNLALAHTGRGYAENAMQFAAFLGRVDAAFQVADAYFFGRGFKLGRNSFSPHTGSFYSEPRTVPLFMPSTAPMRTDPRFDNLVGALGLKTCWAASGHPPDYLREA